MAFNLTDEEKVRLGVVGRTASGREKPVTGDIVWSNDNDAAGSLSGQDGQAIDFVSADALADAQNGNVSVAAMGLTASDSYTVTPAPVASLEIVAGAPQAK